MNIQNKSIRNFAIIAHIDHGKSTLADRLIEHCNGLENREMQEQVLDSMDIERERGITIKSQTVRLLYTAKDGNTYHINLIDTPGHVDFSYEVSRALSACEGSLLVIDATQGIEAQTLANVYQAIDKNHEIIPVINKVDLPAADPDKVKKQIEDVIGISADDAVLISAKQGLGIEDVLEAIVHKLPPPKHIKDVAMSTDFLKALLIDSWYDKYLGVVILIRVFQGVLEQGLKIKFLSNNKEYLADKIGVFTPKKTETQILKEGEIGFITGNIKSIADCKVGDTIICAKAKNISPLPGFQEVKSVLFCSLYPVDTADFGLLKDALEKLKLNDSSLTFRQENSGVLGFGFRCGFLGLLHLEVVQERITREFDLDIIVTTPSVIYKFTLNNGDELNIHNAAQFPEKKNITSMKEPWVKATLFCPEEYLGNLINICMDKRGVQIEMKYISPERVMLIYKLPLNEIVFDFYDKIKSASKGYASFDWDMDSYEESDLVKLTIMINNEVMEAVSLISHSSKAEKIGREICVKLKDLIPRHLFNIPIQAAVQGKVICRENIKPLRKDVLAKCYGGDISRKRKLLEKQKKGRKKMSKIGNVEIPKSTFIDILKIDR